MMLAVQSHTSTLCKRVPVGVLRGTFKHFTSFLNTAISFRGSVLASKIRLSPSHCKMPSRHVLKLLALSTLAMFSVSTAAVSWARIVQLSLPLPSYLPILNILLTILAVSTVPASRRLLSHSKKKVVVSLFPGGMSLVLVALFTLSLAYVMPSDMQSCAADCQWLRLFKNKNDIAIRIIQDRLRCCGYNSMRDRAWPFPSRHVDVKTCERTQGYYIACGGLWRQEQCFAAAMSAVACSLNWLLVVSPTTCVFEYLGTVH